MQVKVEGKIVAISEPKTISDKLKTRDFVVETSEEYNGKNYNQYISMQTVNQKTEDLSKCKVGDMVNVSCQLKGRKWEKDGQTKYFNSLEAWKVEFKGATPTPAPQPQPVDDSGLPF